uniref:Rho GDP-dissociation inhibitor 1 n=1 Tax=Gossypium raimondii TaxID=29730 RepID=A0A0D2SK36_GOSRA|nr:hypothetical protein B456_007G148600 [Gossypium raimondii]
MKFVMIMKTMMMMMMIRKMVLELWLVLYLVRSFLSRSRLRKTSLRRWKEKLLGCVEEDLNGQMEPEVKFHSIGIISNDLEEVSYPLPLDLNRAGLVLFTLKEGSRYQLKLTFSVLHNIVSGLTYSNTVWKAGLKVDQNKGMLGTFAPQREPYVHVLDEETTPSGVLARGIYSANLKFEDDDRRCHMELKYAFEIKKNS